MDRNKFLEKLNTILSGKTLYYLTDNINYKLDFLRKIWIKKLIILYFMEDKKYGINIFYNYFIDIKIIFLNFNSNPKYDLYIFTLKIFKIFKMSFIRKIFFSEVEKVLFVTILEDNHKCILNKIIGNFFLFFLQKKYKYLLFKELKNILEEFLSYQKIIFESFYLHKKYIKVYFFSKEKDFYFQNFDNIHIKLYFKKKIIKKILYNIK